MTDTRDDLRDLQMHRSILRAYVRVLERTDELLALCAATTGDATATRAAIERAFGIGPVEADAVLGMQVRRFTPAAAEMIRRELADADRQIAAAERTAR